MSKSFSDFDYQSEALFDDQDSDDGLGTPADDNDDGSDTEEAHRYLYKARKLLTNGEAI